MLGTPIQLDRIKIPTFVTGALTDHLTPWKGCYRTTQPAVALAGRAGPREVDLYTDASRRLPRTDPECLVVLSV